MRTVVLCSFLAATGFVTGAVTGQANPARNEVIGITLSPNHQTPSLQRQRADYQTCATSGCPVPGLQTTASPFAGGTAWNGDVPPNLTGSVGGVWVSDGRNLALVHGLTCAAKCAPRPAPLQTSTAVVTGLAYWEDRAALLMSDSANYLYWLDTAGCQWSAASCDILRQSVVPAGYTIGGLATNDVERLLFVSASTFGRTPARTKIWVGSLAAVKQPAGGAWCSLPSGCELVLPPCAGTDLGAVTGLGFDACTDTLYVTDGRIVLACLFRFDAGRRTCSLTPLGCCRSAAGAPFAGLCVVQKAAVSVGSACVAAPCIGCPAMRAGTYGAAFLGNRNFALTLSGAPTGAKPVFLALGVGACTTPGVPIGFCAPARIAFAIPPLLIPMRVTQVAGGPCEGRAVFSFGVPNLPRLCGVPISVQWAMDCVGPTGRGRAISNCLTFEITTN